MEENRTSLSIGLIVMIVLGIACAIIVGAVGVSDILEQKKWAEQWEIESSTAVDRIDDSTYHINLGDGSSCFTMEKIGDSLSLSGVNVCAMFVNHDSITVIAKQNSGHHAYRFAYNNFFEGPTPYSNKIGFLMH